MLKRRIGISVFLWLTVSLLMAQDWGLRMDMAEEGYGAGIGWGFSHWYSGLIPGKETQYISSLGLSFKPSSAWFDLGGAPQAIPDPATEYTSFMSIRVYQKNELTQTLWGDHQADPFYLDAFLGTYAQLMVPLNLAGPDKSFFQAGSIIGDKISFPNKIYTGMNSAFFLDDKVWTTSGLKLYEELSLRLGSELDPPFWSFFRNYLAAEGFIPLLRQLLFLDIVTTLDGATAGMGETGALPFFGYPQIDPPAGGITYRDFWAWSGRVDLKSRFLMVDPFIPMSVGVGGYAYTAVVAPTVLELVSLGLKFSVGFYAEYRFEIPGIVAPGIRLGVGFLKDEYKGYDFTPRFLFELFL